MASLLAGYRPWGTLDWVVARYPTLEWSVCGCLGTEDRSIASTQLLARCAVVRHVRLLKVIDPPSRYTTTANEAMAHQTAKYIAQGGRHEHIEEHSLTESHDTIIRSIDNFLLASNGNIAVDVTSLPKRFFFPILRQLIKAPDRVQNLIVTYAVPESYTKERLAENFNDWDRLPLFSGDYAQAPPDLLVASVGFEALGLQDQLDQLNASVRIRLLLPFPAPPAAFQRSWTLVHRLRERLQADTVDVYRCDAKDVSDTFERLTSLSERGKKRLMLAPFGPKPMSVAMCIFATLTESEVFYTQPTIYNPRYSTGVSTIRGVQEIYGYCLRIAGRPLYAV